MQQAQADCAAPDASSSLSACGQAPSISRAGVLGAVYKTKRGHNIVVLRPQPKGLYQRTGIIITGKWFARQTAVYKADAGHSTCRGGYRHMEQGQDNKYHVSDPFFVVECRACGKGYWSTRRVNRKCAKCGSEDVTTRLPERRKEAGNGE